MYYYPNKNYMYKSNHYNDRFILPFLGGALIGGAAVGLTRPRPIYNVAPQPQPIYQPMPQPMPYSPYPYGSYSYSYYTPM